MSLYSSGVHHLNARFCTVLSGITVCFCTIRTSFFIAIILSTGTILSLHLLLVWAQERCTPTQISSRYLPIFTSWENVKQLDWHHKLYCLFRRNAMDTCSIIIVPLTSCKWRNLIWNHFNYHYCNHFIFRINNVKHQLENHHCLYYLCWPNEFRNQLNVHRCLYSLFCRASLKHQQNYH